MQARESCFLVNILNDQRLLALINPADGGPFRRKFAERLRRLPGRFADVQAHEPRAFVVEEDAQEDEFHHGAEFIGHATEQLLDVAMGGNGAGNAA